MTQTHCASCTADTTNGLALCRRCQQTLRVALVNVAALHTDVERIRPGQRVKVRSAYQSTEPPDTRPGVDRISEVLSYTDNAAQTWARALLDDRPQISSPPPGTSPLLGWLESNVPSIATLAWAGEITREMRTRERELQTIIDKSDTGAIAGVCGNEIGRESTGDGVIVVACPRVLYRPPSAAWVRCPECGRTWPAEERREIMRRQAEDEKLPVRAIAKIAVALSNDLSEERLTRRIEQWVRRKQLDSYGVRVLEGKVRRVYRVGDVLALVSGQVKPREGEAC